MSRYNHFDVLFREIRPHTIMEIGTCRGAGAVRILQAAHRVRPDGPLVYFGFDLFETPPAHDTVSMMPGDRQDVQNLLEKKCPYAQAHLIKGDSRESLLAFRDCTPQMDVIFIDGGHSKETVRADWDNAQAYKHDQTVFVLDDYWHDVWGKPHGGVKEVLDDLRTTYHDTLRVKIIEPGDVIHRSRHRELVGRRVHFAEARWR